MSFFYAESLFYKNVLLSFIIVIRIKDIIVNLDKMDMHETFTIENGGRSDEFN